MTEQANIPMATKTETTLVKIGAGFVAAGSSLIVAVAYMPEEIKIPAAAVGASLGSIGGAILTIWDKYVNAQQTKQA
jgi:hypothetical protein